MKLVNGYDLMEYAKRRRLVLPAFNTTNLEMTYGIVKGLAKANLPGYVQISSSNLKLSNPYAIAALAREASKEVEVPIALHLDHGKSFEDVKACCEAGFTSIMVDHSELPYDENVRESRKAADYCHFYHLPVEVELGSIQGKEEDIVHEDGCKTDPDMVADFVERTGCDLLAVSVGNVHGLCLDPQIDLPLLEKISKVSAVPLVLHGGSGIPKEIIWEAKKSGLIKVNYGSALRKEFITTYGKQYEKDHVSHDIIRLSLAAVENISNVTRDLVTMMNEDQAPKRYS